jgi:outer membrane autotransporter protein
VFQDDCDRIVTGALGGNTDGTAGALEVLASDQINAQNSAASRAANIGAAVVQNRLEGIRLASGLPVYQASALVKNNLFRNLTGGAASSDTSFDRFGTFVTLGYLDGNEDQTAFQPGYELDRWSILGGIDYRFVENLVGGLVLRYGDGDFEFDNGRGDMSSKEWGLAGYGTYFLPNGLFFDGLIGYGSNDYTLHRRISYSVAGCSPAPCNADQTATSDPDANLWNFNLGAGYTFYREGWSFTPALRLNYLQNEVDGYSESMSSPISTSAVGSSMALSIAGQTYTSFVSDLSIEIARAISLKSGVLVPQLRLSWLHEFENDQEQVGTFLINDINKVPFFVLTNEPDRDYFDLGIAVSAQFARGASGFISYNALLGYSGVNLQAVNAGVRFEF